jgi:hypothetical protein
MPETIFDRFISNVEKTDTCWNWKGNKNIYGYSRFFFESKYHSGHRFSYSYYKGTIPEGLVVRHTCKNKCVNPDHLEIGTHQQNTQDRKRDGTYQYGERNPRVKLNQEQVAKIRDSFPEKPICVLAREYGVSWTQIKNILTFKSWAS